MVNKNTAIELVHVQSPSLCTLQKSEMSLLSLLQWGAQESVWESGSEAGFSSMTFFFFFLLQRIKAEKKVSRQWRSQKPLPETKDARVVNQKQRARHGERDGVGRAMATTDLLFHLSCDTWAGWLYLKNQCREGFRKQSPHGFQSPK